jgi:hypothetical protein
MAGGGIISMDFKLQFFDRQKVIDAVDAQQKRYLAKAGAYVMKTARRSIRKKKGASDPGDQPHSHEGSLKKLIFFVYEPAVKDVVIGPAGFRDSQAPRALEYGGRTRITTLKGGHKVKGKFQGGKRVKVMATIRARPFMHPALEKAVPQLPALWAASIK